MKKILFLRSFKNINLNKSQIKLTNKKLVINTIHDSLKPNPLKGDPKCSARPSGHQPNFKKKRQLPKIHPPKTVIEKTFNSEDIFIFQSSPRHGFLSNQLQYYDFIYDRLASMSVGLLQLFLQ